MLLTSLNYALSLGFAVTFLLAGLAAAALLHTFRNLAGIELAPLAAGETFAGGTLPFTLAIARRRDARGTRSPLAAGGSAPVTVDVIPDAALPVTLEVPAPRRGRVALGRVTLSSDFPLGLWRGWAYVHFPLRGRRVPGAGSRTRRRCRPGRGGDDAHSESRDDDADLAGLRGYQPGDPLQRVAWKAVARGAGWHTKQFEGGGGGGPARPRLARAAARARRRSADRAPHRLGARRRARGAPVRAAPSRNGAARGTGARASARAR